MRIEWIRILLIVNQLEIGVSLRDRLARLGYHVCAVTLEDEHSSLPECLKNVQLVIVAYDPADGQAAFRTAARVHHEHEIAVVVICENESRMERDEAHQIGRLVSPFNDGDLHATIQLTYHGSKVPRAQALIESEERFEQIAMSINHIFWMCVLPDLKYLYVSPAFEMIWGRPVDDLYDNPMVWLETVHEDDRSRVKLQFENWVRNPTEGTMHFRVVRDGGECRWIIVRGISIRWEEGGRCRVTGVSEDVTDAKMMEIQALRSEKLQAVGQLAGGIAHDFNNFLLLISCYSEQLLDHFPMLDPNRNAVIAIRDAVERAKGLTRQLLAFTRKQVLELTVVDLNELVKKSVDLVKQAIHGNISLRVNLTSRPVTINVDPGQIDQIVLNLILNAQDAMPNGGTVTIETNHYDLLMPYQTLVDEHTPIEIEVLPGHYVGLKVTDTGTGMSDLVKSRIFEPYFSTKQGGKGNGLGLAVVQGIVSQYGGHVKVDSKLGIGTQFEIFFPYAESTAITDSPSAILPGELDGTETILLVEDEPEVRPILKRSLESHGYKVLDAPHGPAALALAIRYAGSIDILLTDVVMPEMDGVEVSQALEAIYPDIATIFISGYANNESVLERVQKGHNGFLQKPFGISEMLLKIREVMNIRSLD